MLCLVFFAFGCLLFLLVFCFVLLMVLGVGVLFLLWLGFGVAFFVLCVFFEWFVLWFWVLPILWVHVLAFCVFVGFFLVDCVGGFVLLVCLV